MNETSNVDDITRAAAEEKIASYRSATGFSALAILLLLFAGLYSGEVKFYVFALVPLVFGVLSFCGNVVTRFRLNRGYFGTDRNEVEFIIDYLQNRAKKSS